MVLSILTEMGFSDDDNVTELLGFLGRGYTDFV